MHSKFGLKINAEMHQRDTIFKSRLFFIFEKLLRIQIKYRFLDFGKLGLSL